MNRKNYQTKTFAAMKLLGPGRAQWEWFVALHPLYERALPKHLPANIRATPKLENDVAMIRQAIRAIPLLFPNVDIDRDLEQSKYDNFSDALASLLEVFETLIEEDVLLAAEQHNVMMPEESELYSKYPKLAVLKRKLGHSELNLISTMALDRSKLPGDESLSELAKHIDYIGFGISRKYSSRDVATKICTFKSKMEDIFADPLEALERDLGNAGKFSHKEIEFIRRAHKLNTLSQSLFEMLVKGITCSKRHEVRLHLSGFLDPEINFELLVTECEREHWKVANCRFVDREWPGSSGPATHGLLCAHTQLTRASSESIRIAFNSEGMWDETHGLLTPHDQGADSIRTLRELLLPKRYDDDDDSGSEPDVQEFVEEDQKIVELLVASSLLNLNTSAWLRTDMNIKSIFLKSSPNLDRRWKPLVACSLESVDVEDEVHDAILSFGLLLMEMEGKRIVRPRATDNDWETGRLSKDSMLRRVVEEWNRLVSDGYRHIATACLQFRELSAKLYDSRLTRDMGQSAAIYKYILAPLHKIATQQHSKISPMFTNFPSSFPSASTTRSYPLVQATSSPGLILFDGFDTHDPTAIKNATTFWENTESFREMINNLSTSSPISVLADPCRKEKIRIAIIDTGIDEDDITIGEAMGERIKECCGFINGPEAKPDRNDWEDQTGHGTHVARLMLEMAPSAELYIAKISNEFSIQPTELHRVTRAIKWAHKDKRVHIISMSFGLGIAQNVETDRAIVAAKRDGITMFAAAANSGGNKPRAYPSNRGPPVICVHASDGLGNDGGISPDPLPDEPNFSTLGISIASKWKGDEVLKSGTSFATPIAAALAADVLEFARHKCDLDEFEFNSLRDYDGIYKILKLMVRKRQGHDYLMPLHLWDGQNDDEAIVQKLYKIAGRG